MSDIAETVAVIRDLLESRGLLDARLEVYAALEGASEEDAEELGVAKIAPNMPVYIRSSTRIFAEVFQGNADITKRALRLVAALAWRILEREAGR